uniref:Uncharacterized protein n=1 Tax=Anguilla anguilla TaxID=7936 RepID=A0A0E9VIK5_ANGAN
MASIEGNTLLEVCLAKKATARGSASL